MGNFHVPYYTAYKHLNDDYVEFSNAVTYNLEGGKIVKTKTGREGRFKKTMNEFWNEVTLVLANVKVGSVVEFKYTLRTDDISEFPTFIFQYDIPVNHCTYNTVIPQYFQYKSILCGIGTIFNKANIVEETQHFQDENNQSARLSYQAVSRYFFREDIPALKSEPYVDNLENYRSAVKHELEKVEFPEQEPKQYSTTWEAVALDIYKNEKFGDELKERQYFEAYLEPYIRQAKNQTDLVASILNYLQQHMTWDNKYGYLVKKGVKKAFADKTGNVAEINLMLVSMLNHAGIRAYPVLVSTIDNGIASFPNRGTFNYVIASAELDGKIVLLDATSKHSAPNILPFRDLNWHGWRIMGDGTATQIDLVPSTVSKEMYTVLARLDASGKISGKARIIKTDYYGYGFREKYKGANPDDYVQKLENDFGIEVADYSFDAPDNSAKPIEEKFDFKADTEVIGDKIYINPLLFLTKSKNPFASDVRLLPVYYGFPQMEKNNITIEIPDGYAVVSIPQPVSVQMPENVGTFTMNI